MAQTTENKSKYNRQLSSDEVQQFTKTASLLSLGAIIFMVVFFILVHHEGVRLFPASMTADKLNTFSGRIEYTLRYQTLLVAWLIFNIFSTIYGRYVHRALNPLNEVSEEHVQIHKNILTNSVEQILISVFAQLIYVTFAGPGAVLKYIPLVNVIQFIGRITFMIGYPMERSFGFLLTVIPNIVLVIYNIVNFLGFVV